MVSPLSPPPRAHVLWQIERGRAGPRDGSSDPSVGGRVPLWVGANCAVWVTISVMCCFTRRHNVCFVTCISLPFYALVWLLIWGNDTDRENVKEKEKERQKMMKTCFRFFLYVFNSCFCLKLCLFMRVSQSTYTVMNIRTHKWLKANRKV